MPRTSILSLVVLPLVLALAVFAWTPGLVVRAAAPTRVEAPPLELVPDVRPADGAGIDAVVDAFYAVQADVPGARERLLGLFHPSAAREAARALRRRDAAVLAQHELSREARAAADVAQVWSTYALAVGPDAPAPDADPVGVRSLQLVHDEGRWWLYAVAAGTPAPAMPAAPGR